MQREVLSEIDYDDNGFFDVEGVAADGIRIEIVFTCDGVLSDYEWERDDRLSLPEEAAREQLVALFYADVGYVERGGRHVTALAVNPYGDAVEVRWDDRGNGERERLWQN